MTSLSMTLHQQQLIVDSACMIRPKLDETTQFFYLLLFDCAPHYRPLFPTDMDQQPKKLGAMLAYVVGTIYKPETLEKPLLDLGSRHRGMGLTALDYNTIKIVLLQTLEYACGNVWTQDTEEAWSIALDFISETMMRGADEEQLNMAG